MKFMSDLTKEAAYIKGLFDGLKLDPDKDVTKILSSIIDYIQKSADQMDMLDQEQGFLADQIDDIEEVIDVIAEEISSEYDDDDDYMDDMYQIKCENCGSDIEFTGEDIDDLVEGNFACPNCGDIIELDLSEADDCGCGCGCEHDHE